MTDPVPDSIQITIGQALLGVLITASSAVIVGLLSFFGGRGSVQAQLQGQLNASMKALIDEQAELRKVDQQTIRDLNLQLRSQQIYISKLAKALIELGADVPPPPEVVPILMLDSLPAQPMTEV